MRLKISTTHKITNLLNLKVNCLACRTMHSSHSCGSARCHRATTKGKRARLASFSRTSSLAQSSRAARSRFLLFLFGSPPSTSSCVLCLSPVLSQSVFKGCVRLVFIAPVGPQGLSHSATLCRLGGVAFASFLVTVDATVGQVAAGGPCGSIPNPSLPHWVPPGYILCPCPHYNRVYHRLDTTQIKTENHKKKIITKRGMWPPRFAGKHLAPAQEQTPSWWRLQIRI
jgi:hypothetical protein